MRWNRMWGLLTLLLALAGGCKQRGYLTEADNNYATVSLTDHMDREPELASKPLTEPSKAPPTLDDLDRRTRFISLAEAVALALEHGRVGQPSLLFPGTALDNGIQFVGGNGVSATATSGSDSIRALALDPARNGANVEASLSKFDAALSASMTWQGTDQPIGTSLQTFQAGNSGINATVQQDANFSMALLKPLASGGVAGITFNVPYTFTNLPARVNPSYRPQLLFQFEQPLLQGFGVEINQLRAAHPGSILNPGILNGSPTAEGTLITRLRFDQSRADFERQLNQMLLNVEVAYWNLYGAYWTLYSREQGLRFAYETFRQNKAEYEAGKGKPADFFQSRGQYEQFRAQRLQAIDQVLDYERQLRALVGITIEDGTRLMPSDSPTLAPIKPDWNAARSDAIDRRPEIYMARQDVKAAQLRLILVKNSLMPDLRFTSSYDVNSIGTSLDGNDPNNAFRNLANNNFHNYSAGLRMVMPIGYRLAYTQVRQAQLDMSRTLEVLKDQELKAESLLALYYRRLSLNYKQIQANRAQREAFGEQLRARSSEFAVSRITLPALLEAQRAWADALNSEFQSIVLFNNALAGFEYAKGSIQQHNNVHIAEGPVPGNAFVRAADHQRARTAALVLRERAAPAVVTPDAPPGAPCAVAPSLPATMAAHPPLKEVLELPASADELKNAREALVEKKPEEVFSNATPTPATPPAGLSLPAAPVPTGSRKPSRRTTEFGLEHEAN